MQYARPKHRPLLPWCERDRVLVDSKRSYYVQKLLYVDENYGKTKHVWLQICIFLVSFENQKGEKNIAAKFCKKGEKKYYFCIIPLDPMDDYLEGVRVMTMLYARWVGVEGRGVILYFCKWPNSGKAWGGGHSLLFQFHLCVNITESYDH